MTATGVSAGAPAVGSPALSQAHSLTAQGIASGSPQVGSPALSIVHNLTAEGISAGVPGVGSPAITQNHALVAVGISAGDPQVGRPALVSVNDDERQKYGGGGKKRKSLPNIQFAPAYKPDPVIEPEEDKPEPPKVIKPSRAAPVVKHGILHVPLTEQRKPYQKPKAQPAVEYDDDEEDLELLLVA